MKSMLLVAGFILVVGCSPPPPPIPPATSVKETTYSASGQFSSKNTPAAQPAKQEPLLPPKTLLVSQWRGVGFTVLPKQEILRHNGYELYSCRPGACASAKIDTAWELANHRIRCDRLSGEYIFVESIERTTNEWLVIFNFPKADKKLYATTRDLALIELAPASDLDGARKRWLGTTVFARRGVLSAFGTNSPSSFVSFRVDIQDSLTVTDVRWGLTPLPVKPIWLMVASRSGKSGFIPVRYSWTNTMQRQVGAGNPWEEDIFEKNPAEIYQWDDATWELVNNHRVVLDMTEEQVRISWGDPVSIGSTLIGQESQIVWTFQSQQLFFVAKRLVSIRDLPLSGQ